ncbi:MAG TPA: long-chain fatty acid--CoA ligase [Candidatus Acidoferrales bacterium]|nr:long-chain fatty acid--CoA ligase [Candidatus Acidoferrales bacterium]
MRSTMMPDGLTLDLLAERAEALFSAVPIVSRAPDRRLVRSSYGEVMERARALAGGLQAEGLQPGDRVASLMWNHQMHLEAYFGVPLAGGVLHTLNPRLSIDDLVYIIRHGGDRFLILDEGLLPLYAQLREHVTLEKVWVVRWQDAPLEGAGLAGYEDLLATGRGRFMPHRLDEADPCLMCYTSGTTGRPKGVVYSHRSTVLHAMAITMPDAVGLSCRDVVTPVVPMFHANAWGLPFAATLVGARQVFPGPHLDAVNLLDLFAGEGVTVTAGVPTIWLSLLEALRQEPERWNLPAMRTVVGGSAVPAALIEGLAAFGMSVIQGWGMTETSPLAALAQLKPAENALPPVERLRYQTSQGLPCPLVRLRIADDAGQALPWDGVRMGEVQVRGPWITGAYHGDEGTDKFTADGWLRTGDVAVIDPKGYVFLTDRTKDLIKSGGEWISSVALENALMNHPAVLEAAVIAVADERWGERPLAVVVFKSGETATVEDLKAHLAARFAKWMVPERYVFATAIPRTSTGKFNKLALRAQYRQTAEREGDDGLA